MTLAFVHVIAHLPHYWHLSAGRSGWWMWREWPAFAGRAARTYGMEGFGWARGHAIAASEWR